MSYDPIASIAQTSLRQARLKVKASSSTSFPAVASSSSSPVATVSATALPTLGGDNFWGDFSSRNEGQGGQAEFAEDDNVADGADATLSTENNFNQGNVSYELRAYKLQKGGFFVQKDKVFTIYISKCSKLVKVVEESNTNPLHALLGQHQKLSSNDQERYGYIIEFDMPRIMIYGKHNCKLKVLFPNDTQETFSVFDTVIEDTTNATIPFSELTEDHFRSIQLRKSMRGRADKGALFLWLSDKLELDQWQRGELTFREVVEAETGEASNSAVSTDKGNMDDNGRESKKRRRNSEQNNDRDGREDKEGREGNNDNETSNLSGLAQIVKVKREMETVESTLTAAQNDSNEKSQELELWQNGQLQIREVFDIETGETIQSAVPAVTDANANDSGNEWGRNRNRPESGETEQTEQTNQHSNNTTPSQKSNLAQLAHIKQEKETIQKSLQEAREDCEDAEETLQQQTLFTDSWQGKFDELAKLAAEAGVDGGSISKLRDRKVLSG